MFPCNWKQYDWRRHASLSASGHREEQADARPVSQDAGLLCTETKEDFQYVARDPTLSVKHGFGGSSSSAERHKDTLR